MLFLVRVVTGVFFPFVYVFFFHLFLLCTSIQEIRGAPLKPGIFDGFSPNRPDVPSLPTPLALYTVVRSSSGFGRFWFYGPALKNSSIDVSKPVCYYSTQRHIIIIIIAIDRTLSLETIVVLLPCSLEWHLTIVWHTLPLAFCFKPSPKITQSE